MAKISKTERRRQILEMARRQFQVEGTLEIDNNAKISDGDDNGAYVAAWVWASFENTPLDREADSRGGDKATSATGER